jgi:bla regulator protein blaR1
MKFLEAWVSTPLAGALGWTLIHSLWEGAFVSVALAAALWTMRSARARYAAACAAMLALLAAIVFTFARLVPGGMHGLSSAEPLPLPLWRSATNFAGAAPGDGSFAALVPWLAPLWLIGVWIFILGQIGGWISVARLRRQGVCCAPERWQNELARLRAKLRLSRPVQLLESCLAEVPAVVGHIRPVILMPVGLLSGLPAGQVEAILLHELAHIRRHDYFTNVLQRSVETLLFYNPAVWWISRVIRTERENCCDDMVVATSGNAREYAVALAALEENRWPARKAAVAATGGNLVKRIQRLLDPKPATAVWTPLLAAIVLLITSAVAFAAWPARARQQSSAAEQQAQAQRDEQLEKAQRDEQQQKVRDENSPYQKWLNQEVVYIITPEERAAFEKLTTDDERQKFVEQFWERRNPHPGSPVNTYKQQYYHRLAYANEHFTTATRPGWQSDRGHMLLVYGPPDEIDAHPANKPFPYEEWMYRHVEGLGDNVTLTFIDRSHSGDYQLAPGPVNSAPAKKQSSQIDSLTATVSERTPL